MACRRTAGRKRAPSCSPAQPPIRIRSGWNRLTRSDSPAPRYSAVSSSTPSATGSGVPPRSGWAAASSAVSEVSSSAPSGGRPPASRQRATSASAPAYASRQPSAPHRQRRPRTRTVRWPHSRARPCSTSSETRQAPTPEPNRTTTASPAPRPAPNHISAWPRVLAPLSMKYGTRSGSPDRSRSRASSGTASQPMVCPCTVAPRSGSRATIPGTPMPTPSSRSGARPAVASTSATPSRMWPVTTSTSYRWGSSGRSVRETSASDRSNSSTRTRVSPTSTPIRCPLPGTTRSRVLGRPPSESTLPASSTTPSAISSATTLLTDPELSPVAGPRSKRVSGPSKYNWRRTAARLPRRRSRTVRPFRALIRFLPFVSPNARYLCATP